MTTTSNTINTLQFTRGNVDHSHVSHVRYDQYYHGVLVWGAQVIYHVSPSRVETMVTGQLVKGISQDVTDLDGKISGEEAKKIALTHSPTTNEAHIKKIIYLQKKSHKAVLAYLVSYATKNKNGPALPHFIIDANTGEILRFWNALQTTAIGQGIGGVGFNNLSYRPGRYQFGTVQAKLNTIGKMDITFKGGVCYTATSIVQVINLRNQSIYDIPFGLPVSSSEVTTYKLAPFKYACSAPTYRNLTDGGYAPANGGWSPINDVTYFVTEAYNMYVLKYHVKMPVGKTLPLRIYTHINDFANAFACSPICMRESGIRGPSQLVFGNGGSEDAPFTDIGTSGHEFAHLITDNFSALVYDKQSGGINESFSDMAEFALKNYLRAKYPWIWNGKDWTIGLETSKVKRALRYMNNPPLDGYSIDNARNYSSRLDVHYSSGVFNKAFYLLSTTPGWSVDKAFQVMLDANMNYWTPTTNFNSAACGVIQAAYQYKYKTQDVVRAFQLVGVACAKEVPFIF